MPIPLALPMIPAIAEAVAAGGITAASLAALYDRLNSDDVTTRYREEFGDQLRVAMPPSTSTAPTRPSVPYSPIIEEYRYTPGDALQILGINPLDVAIDTRTETPYEAHPRTRFHSIVLDANGNPYSASTESRQSASAGNNPQNNEDENKKEENKGEESTNENTQNTQTPSFRRAPITSIRHKLPDAWRWLRTPQNGVSPLGTLTQWGLLGGATVGTGWGLYELFDNDNESRPTTTSLRSTSTTESGSMPDTSYFRYFSLPLEELFNQ